MVAGRAKKPKRAPSRRRKVEATPGVRATGGKVCEVNARVKGGTHRIAVVHLGARAKEATRDDPANLFVPYLEFETPASD